MFSIPQMVLVTLWFTFYNLLTSGHRVWALRPAVLC